MKKMLIIIGILLIPLVCNAKSNNDSPSSNMYLKIYKEIKKSKFDTPLERASTQLSVDSDELMKVLNNQGNIKDVCNKLDMSDLNRCVKETNNLFSFEKQIAEMEEEEKLHALATEIWMNGTVKDSEFDLIVDLNVIDVIYFGKGAAIPNVRGFDPFEDDNNDSGAKDENVDKEDTLIVPVDLPDYEFINKTTEGDEEVINEENNEGDEKVIDKENNEDNYSEDICRDPDALFFATTENNTNKDSNSDGSIDPDSDSNSNSSKSSTNTSLREGIISGADQEYRGSYYPSFIDENGNGGDGGCSGDQVEMFGNMFCVPKFCNGIICIEIEFISGRANRNYYLTPASGLASNPSTKDYESDCIKCLVDYTDEKMEETFLLKDRLAPEGHSTKHWYSRIWQFGDFIIHIDTLTKPGALSERITRDKDMTLVEEYRHAVSSAINQGSGSFVSANGDTDENVDNYKLLQSIISKNCETFLNLQKEGASLNEITGKCRQDLIASQSNFIQDISLIRSKLLQYSEEKKLERKQQRWEEITKPSFAKFAEEAKAVDNLLRFMPTAKKFNEIRNNNCKTENK